MINVSELKRGDVVRLLKANERMGLKEGDTLRVVRTGRSSWDRMDYADCVSKSGVAIDIYESDYEDYELLTS